MSTERTLVITQIDASHDLVHVLVALLTACRNHSEHLAALQGVNVRASLAETSESMQGELADASLTKATRATKRFIVEHLTSAKDWILTARGLAIGIDLAIRSEDESLYRALCNRRGVRTLKDLDPVPTPRVPLERIIGGGGFSMESRNSAFAVDSVPGLSLWNSSSFGSLSAIYDPDAGIALDAALRDSFDMLVVSPNQTYEAEFLPATHTPTGFFGIAVMDRKRQNRILRESLKYCVKHQIDILVLPELSATPDTEKIVRRALATRTRDTNRPWPSVAICGSLHMDADGRKVNRLSVIYRGLRDALHHDKVGRYVVGKPELVTSFGLQPNQAGEEGIDRGSEIRIHSGTRWSMIPLICADFLDTKVVNAVASLHPTLVTVSAMSLKTTDFDKSAGTVISACQSIVAIANGPVEWPGQQSGRGQGAQLPIRAAVAVFALPLAEPTAAVLRIEVPATASAPHSVRFNAKTRSAHLL